MDTRRLFFAMFVESLINTVIENLNEDEAKEFISTSLSDIRPLTYPITLPLFALTLVLRRMFALKVDISVPFLVHLYRLF